MTLKNFVRAIVVAVAMTTLTACSWFMPTIEVTVDTTCDWFEDQQASRPTKEWLRNSETPEHVDDFIRRVGENTQLSIRNCNHIERRND